MRSFVRIAMTTAFATSALLGAAACVDLFHSTDFPTLCASDAEACEAEASSRGDARAPEASAEAAAPIDFCSNSPSEARRVAERACGYLGACLGTTEDSNFGACLIRALAAYDCSFNPSLRPRGEHELLWDCLSRVESCDGVALCVFGTKAPGCPSGITDPTPFTRCNQQDGSVVLQCGPSTTPRGMTPCALRGRTCTDLDESTSICTGKRGGSCTVTPRCDGTSAVTCKSAGGIGSDEGTDCAAYGDGRCARDDAGVACAPPASAGACALGKTSEVRCSDAGTFAESCVDGRAVMFNCAGIGLGCSAAGVSTTDPISACKNLDAGSACATTADTCSGGKLESCAQGQTFTLSCANVPGLGACVQPTNGRARCSAD